MRPRFSVHGKLAANVCIALSSSRNAVSCSSGTHNETLFLVTMCVSNPDVRTLESIAENAAQTPSGFAEIVSDDFPIFHLVGRGIS